MKKPELLSPVGNIESLYAAIEAGCDAVYLGGKHFGARNYSDNFTSNRSKGIFKMLIKVSVPFYKCPQHKYKQYHKCP